MIEVFHAIKPTFGMDMPGPPYFRPAPVWPKGYAKVAHVDVADDDHGRVFELTNHISHAWQENTGVEPVGEAKEGARSTSVGDIIVLSDGRVLECASIGWKEVEG